MAQSQISYQTQTRTCDHFLQRSSPHRKPGTVAQRRTFSLRDDAAENPRTIWQLQLVCRHLFNSRGRHVYISVLQRSVHDTAALRAALFPQEALQTNRQVHERYWEELAGCQYCRSWTKVSPQNLKHQYNLSIINWFKFLIENLPQQLRLH